MYLSIQQACIEYCCEQVTMTDAQHLGGKLVYLSCFQGVYSIVGNHYNKQETAVRERSKSHGRVSPGLHDIQGQTPSSVLRPVNECDQEVK